MASTINLKVYYLSSCSTCARIMKDVQVNKFPFVLQDIKTEPITVKQLDAMKKLAGSYEALFSRVALKYRSWGLNEVELTEKDFRKYILEEYTFLKRPVFIIEHEIFIGNAAKTTAAVSQKLKNLSI